MPHNMYHERRPAAATGGGSGPRRTRIMRTAPHEVLRRHDMDVDDDGSAPASFTAWLASSRFGGMPAAASAVAGLPPVPETTVTAGGAGEETCCAVCLEGYAAGDALRTMPCAHAFHGECIVEWLSVSSFRPLCRFKLPTQAEEDAVAAQHQQPASQLG